MYVSVYVCMYVCMYVRTYVCMCIYVCMYVSKFVCVYVYMYVIYACIHVRTKHWRAEVWTLTARMHMSVRQLHLCDTKVIVTYTTNDASMKNVPKVSSETHLCGTQAVPCFAIFSHVKEIRWLRYSVIWRRVTGWHQVPPKRRISITYPTRAKCPNTPPRRPSQNQHSNIHFPSNVQV